MTVLFIDDDVDTRLLVRELLAEAEAAGAREIEVRWLDAGSVDDAVREHGDAAPDAILLDHRLGSADGIELLAWVRSIWRGPVWVCTNVADHRMEQRAIQHGARGVLEKDHLLRDGGSLLSLIVQITESQPASRSPNYGGV